MSAPAGVAGRRATIAYEPALDGLRAVAVLAIAGYHADLPWLRGGFLGVDIFFVLSGYLITRLLLAEGAAGAGIAFAAFWERRARRLLPALLLLLAAVAAYAAFVAAPVDGARIRGDAFSTLFYVNNWWRIARGQSYFDELATTSPLHHTWSISLEEQFYLFWPLLVGLVLARSRGARGLGALSVAGALASAGWMAWLYVPGVDPTRVYFGTDTRIQEVLVGAVLASGVHAGAIPGDGARRHALLALALACAGGILFACSLDAQEAPWLYRGGMLVVSAGVAVVIAGARLPGPNPLAAVLTLSPLRLLGRVSYGFYLWHMPVYLVVTRDATGLEGLVLFFARAGVTFAVSLVSYYAVEQPIRRGALAGRALAAGAAGSVLAAGLVILATPRPVAPAPGSPSLAASLPQLPEGARALRTLLVGDSVAWSLGNGFRPSLEAATAVSLVNRAIPGCGLAHGRFRERGREFTRNLGGDCAGAFGHWRRYLEEADPDFVLVLSGNWDVRDRKVDGEWLTFGSEASDRHLSELFEQATEVLSSTGAHVVYLTAAYVAHADRVRAFLPVGRERWRLDRFNELLRRHAAERSDVSVVELGSWVCGGEACEGVRDGVVLRNDGYHFSRAGAVRTAAWVAGEIRRLADGPGSRGGGARPSGFPVAE